MKQLLLKRKLKGASWSEFGFAATKTVKYTPFCKLKDESHLVNAWNDWENKSSRMLQYIAWGQYNKFADSRAILKGKQ
jgi:hypothetical protein